MSTPASRPDERHAGHDAGQTLRRRALGYRSERRCGSCGRSWSARASRFCGACGAPLTEPDDTAGPLRTATSSRRPSRRATVTVAAMLVIGAVSLLAAGPALRAVSTPPDQAAIAAPETPSSGEAPLLGDRDPDQAAELRAALDPDRLRCSPDPCEVWRASLGSQHHWRLEVREARLAFLDGSDVVVVEAGTGAELLRAPFPLPSTSLEGATREHVDTIRTVAVEDGVVVLGGSEVALLDHDGALRWLRDLPVPQLLVQAVDDRLLVAGLDPSTGSTRTWLLDLVSGATVFEGEGLIGSELHRSDELLLWGTGEQGRAVNVDARTGAVRWERDLAAPDALPMRLGDLLLVPYGPINRFEGLVAEAAVEGWFDSALQPIGPPDVLQAELEAMPASELLDVATGETRARLEDTVVAAAASDGRIVVATAASADAAQLLAGSRWGADDIELSLLELDPSGALLGSSRMTLAGQSCCVFALASTGDRIVATTGEGNLEVLPDGGLAPITSQDAQDVHGLLHDWRPSAYVLSTTDGASVSLLPPSEASVLGRDGDVVVVTDGRELLGVRLAPAAP